MAEVIPFKGILYDSKRISGEDVVAPPYDVISDDMLRRLYAKSPYNIARIDAGEVFADDSEQENKYRRASRFLAAWLDEGILSRSEKDCFYAYEMEYALSGRRQSLLGFFGLVKLTELGKGIHPHEETHAKPKVDRLNLMLACRANTSPIFSLYRSAGRSASRVLETVAKTRPYLEARDPDGAIHRLWVIEGDDEIRTIARDLEGKDIFIADGHHRYETALEYQRMQTKTDRDPACDYVLMFLANMADGGISILPTHRVVKCGCEEGLAALGGFFDVHPLGAGADIVAEMAGMAQTIGLYEKKSGKRYLLTFRGKGLEGVRSELKALDVKVLHELIFRELLEVSDIVYEMDPGRALSLVDDGGYDAAFFLNPTRVEDVERVALASLRMPPKSTYFYPKVMTGFVINSLKNTIC